MKPTQRRYVTAGWRRRRSRDDVGADSAPTRCLWPSTLLLDVG
ncbi:hypothetical protein [Gordonia asplenii]|nr:hypothetical protein [Gordonia asplenii]